MIPSLKIELIPAITSIHEPDQPEQWGIMVWLTIWLEDDDGEKRELIETQLFTDDRYDNERAARFASRDYVYEMAQWTGVKINRD